MPSKDQIWRDKLRDLTNGIGPVGVAVYNELVADIEDAMDEAVEEAEKRGEAYGRWQEGIA